MVVLVVLVVVVVVLVVLVVLVLQPDETRANATETSRRWWRRNISRSVRQGSPVGWTDGLDPSSRRHGGLMGTERIVIGLVFLLTGLLASISRSAPP